MLNARELARLRAIECGYDAAGEAEAAQIQVQCETERDIKSLFSAVDSLATELRRRCEAMDQFAARLKEHLDAEDVFPAFTRSEPEQAAQPTPAQPAQPS